MPGYTRDYLDSLKSRIGIVELAQALGFEVRQGRMKCLDPGRHSQGDRSPSLSLNSQMGRFKCWVCADVKGDHFDFIRRVKQCTFPESVAWLEQYLGLSPNSALGSDHRNTSPSPSRSLPPAPEPQEIKAVFDRSRVLEDFWHLLEDPAGEAELYLRKRKIFKTALVAAKVKMIPHPEQFGDRLLERHPLSDLQAAGLFSEKGFFRFWNHPLIFPYFKAGKFNWFQARAIQSGVQPKEMNLTGSCPAPFYAKVLNGHIGKVFVCEGAIDALTLIQKGFDAIALPGAGSFKKDWLELFQNKTIFLELDADLAGQQAAERLFQLFSEAGLRVFWQPSSPDLQAPDQHRYQSVQDFKKPLLNWGEDLNDLYRRH